MGREALTPKSSDGRRALASHYRSHLHDVLLPFWLDNAVDTKHGGVFTCFDNLGTRLYSRDKYTWSQGRFVWLTARLARMAGKGLVEGDPTTYLTLAQHTQEFLAKHAVLPDATCVYLLEDDGTPKEAFAGAGLNPSRFADAFVVLGAAELGAAQAEQGDQEIGVKTLDWALRLHRALAPVMATGNVPSAPYPIPTGHTAHSFPMIMLNVSQTLGAALKTVGHIAASEVEAYRHLFLEQTLSYTHADGAVTEVRPETDAASAEDLPLYRTHANPGHAIESMWFVLHEVLPRGQQASVERALKVIEHSLEIGWDEEYGGLPRFVSPTGGRPHGRVTDHPMDRLIDDTWSTKLWWPHSEALYATLLAHRLTGDERSARWYERVHEYVFSTFPNPDTSVGEWIQIRDRTGAPLEKVVALPVKDPFHIIRNVLGVIELLARWEAI